MAGDDNGRRNGRPSAVPTTSEVKSFLDREPPSAPRAEMSLLGSLLLDPARVPEVVGIVSSGEMFASDRHTTIYDAILKVYNETGTIDIVQLVEYLTGRGRLEDVGGAEYLVSLAEGVPAATNAARYGAIVREKYQLRTLINAAGQILYDAYHAGAATGEEVRTILDGAEAEIFKVAETADAQEAEDLRALLEAQLTFLSENEGRVVTGLDTGFFDLNEMTSGLHPGEMTIVAGRPSMGKTAFALNLAEQVAGAGERGEAVAVGIFSMEMSRGSVAQRMLCSLSGVDGTRVRRNTLRRDDFDRLLTASDRLSKLPIHIDDTPGLTPMLLRAKARRMAHRFGVKCFFVDYLQLMSSPAAIRDGRQNEVSQISRQIKALARDLRVPIVCLAQLNRGAEQREGHRPRMADLRESGSIEQDADVILLLHREAYYHSQDPLWAQQNPEKANEAEVIIAKQRNGPTGVVTLHWDSGITRFRNKAFGRTGGSWGGTGSVEPKGAGGQATIGEVEDPGEAPV